MTALGCLAPFVLMIVGGLAGAALGGNHGGLIGLIVGFIVGLLAGVGMFWGLARVERR